MNALKTLARIGASTLVIGTLSLSAASAQSDDNLSAERFTTERGMRVSGASIEDRIRRHLSRSGFSEDALDTLSVTREWAGRNGRTHMEFEQLVDGKRVMGSLVRAAIDAEGQPLTISQRLSNGDRVRGKNNLSASEAVNLAAARHHEGAPSLSGQGVTLGNVTSFDKGGYFYTDPTAEEVIVANRAGRMEPGWLVTTWGDADNELVETVLNSRGRIVSVQNRTADDRYNVFEIHPDVSVQETVQGPNSTVESPVGWLGSGTQYATLISGNNARAYLDRDRLRNRPDAPSRVVVNGDFLTVAQLNQSPTTTTNQEVAVQNLFYLNNVIHDALYSYGFTEATRNFQEDNFGRGGLGSDSVNAEAQDGRNTNNANFTVPSDGSNPRMQMYLWNTTANGLDGDLDTDIVWHEYGHGLTWRMIGSMEGDFPGAIGEGMSDGLAIIMTDDDIVGEYSTANDIRGVRRFRYEGYPLTFANFTGTSVHSDGEIYGATMWDLKKRYEAAGLDRDDVMLDLVDGMNFTAPAPDFLDMRDGILDATPASRDCLVWQAFSKFGMGESASYSEGSSGYEIIEDFTPPSSCS